MQRRLSEVDITNYVLNELEPRERLFVESMMLGCEKDREDAIAMMGLARMLEEGFEQELAVDLSLDPTRRSEIVEVRPASVWHSVVKVSAAFASLAACVVFSVAAPVLSRYALQTDAGSAQAARKPVSGMDSVQSSDVADPGAFPVMATDSGDSVANSQGEDFPTRVLLPTGTVNFAEMPAAFSGGEAN